MVFIFISIVRCGSDLIQSGCVHSSLRAARGSEQHEVRELAREAIQLVCKQAVCELRLVRNVRAMLWGLPVFNTNEVFWTSTSMQMLSQAVPIFLLQIVSHDESAALVWQ